MCMKMKLNCNKDCNAYALVNINENKKCFVQTTSSSGMTFGRIFNSDDYDVGGRHQF